MVIGRKYKVLDLLGQGGMSKVYLVLDLKLQKKWAVKEIRNANDTIEQQLYFETLLAEIKVLKNLDHPALPRIVDVIEEEGCIYVVMDYIEGERLSELLQKEGAFSPYQVVVWAKELCEVLQCLHEQEIPIIYRDMKPANIIITANGHVKLIDFGSVREYKQQNENDTISLGTRGYAAPEQFGGKGQTDVRTDIYSLGVTLYQLLTGEHPWNITGEFMAKKARERRLSPGWEHIIRKCIWRNPNLRYQSCRELKKDLDCYEALNKKLRRKRQNRERLIRVGKRFVIFCLILYIFFLAKEQINIGVITWEKIGEFLVGLYSRTQKIGICKNKCHYIFQQFY